MSELKTYTVDELVAYLTQFPSDTKIVISSDSEGNDYGTITADSFEHSKLDKTVAIYPAQERLDYDDVFPKAWEAEEDD